MSKLNTNVGLVKAILEEDKQTRNSDSLLYLRVLEHIAREKDIELQNVTVTQFLTSMGIFGFPGFETIRRTRQKIQSQNSELKACDEVEEYRDEMEQEFRAFAREV